MKLLLTSNGITNPSIANALEEMVGKPRDQIKIAFIPNAGLAGGEFSAESVDWLVDNMNKIEEFCGFIDVVSLTDLTKEEILERLEFADVIFVGGGSAFYLSYCMEINGLFDELPRLLESRVYVGLSAGCMVVSHNLRTARGAVRNLDKFHEGKFSEIGPAGRSSGRTAKFVNFIISPHMNNPSAPHVNEDYLKNIAEDVDVPLYALDDDSAIKVIDDNIEVISEGEWKLYN